MGIRWLGYKEVDRKRRKGIDGMKIVGRRELIETYWNVNAP